jgi:murein DD-endopeptidase MepM/ murein hydrolase activator NlpD
MNPQLFGSITSLVSMKQEVKLVFITFAIICLLPVFAVMMATQVGIALVSNALATVNIQSLQIDIHNPATGAVVDSVSASVIWPVSGPVSLEFGQSDLPYQPIHTGIDIATTNHQVGNPVTAFMKGTVIYADETSWGFGKHVKIVHGHHIVSIYAHLDSINVTVGQEVEAGIVIGTLGSTGWSTGPHLHFQVNVFGLPVNPRTFLEGNP